MTDRVHNNDTDIPDVDNRNLLTIVDSINDIADGQVLADLLNKRTYVAVKNADKFALVDKCKCIPDKSGRFGLASFGYNKKLQIYQEPISENVSYLLIGPGVTRGG
jgi:hypothetical protein